MSEHDVDAVVARVAREYYTSCYVEHIDDTTWEELPDSRRHFFCSHTKVVLSYLRSGDRLPGGGVWMPENPTEAIADAMHAALYDCFSPEPGEGLNDGWELTVYSAALAAATEGQKS